MILKRYLANQDTAMKYIKQPIWPAWLLVLAWTYVGGDILFIETSLSDGKGELKLTGNLGNVMKESASTALTYLQSNANKYRH